MMTMCEGLELPKFMGNTVSMCSIFSHCFKQLAVLLEKIQESSLPTERYNRATCGCVIINGKQYSKTTLPVLSASC